MKKLLLIGMVLMVFQVGQALAILQCGPGGVIVDNTVGSAHGVVNGILNFSTFQLTYTGATISSTSGCNGFLAQIETEKKRLVAERYQELKEDSAQGLPQRHLVPLAALNGCENTTAFAQAMKRSYGDLFVNPVNDQPTVEHFVQQMDQMIQNDPALQNSCGFRAS